MINSTQLRLFFGRDLNKINKLRHQWRLAIAEVSDFKVMMMNLKMETSLISDTEVQSELQLVTRAKHIEELALQINHSEQLADQCKAQLKHDLIERALTCSPLQLSLIFQQGFHVKNKKRFIENILTIKDLTTQIRCTPKLMEMENEAFELEESLQECLEESFVSIPASVKLEGSGSITQSIDKVIKKTAIYFHDTITTELRFPRTKINYSKLTQGISQDMIYHFESARHHEHEKLARKHETTLKTLDALSTELILELFPEE